MKRILIIEDDKLFAELLQLGLSQYQVELADRVTQAIELINQQQFDLIILDLLLPGYNGIGLINELVGSDLANKIPIIICSSVAEKLDKEQLAGANVKAVLNKTTFKPDELRRLVDQVLNYD